MSDKPAERYEDSELYRIRHSAAHVMAQAVQELFPGQTKIAIGPPIADGFYYDFDLPRALVDGSTLPAVPLSDEPQARRFVGWMRYLAVHRACQLGDLALAERLDREAAPLLATDADYR